MKSCQDIEIYNSLVRKINEIIGELLRYETVVRELNSQIKDIANEVNKLKENQGAGISNISIRKVNTDEIFTLDKELPKTFTITLDKSTLSFIDKTSQTLIATVQPSNTDDTVVWSSSDETVATVVSGVVTPKKTGSCTIIATCGNQSATCSITVELSEVSIITNGLVKSLNDITTEQSFDNTDNTYFDLNNKDFTVFAKVERLDNTSNSACPLGGSSHPLTMQISWNNMLVTTLQCDDNGSISYPTDNYLFDSTLFNESGECMYIAFIGNKSNIKAYIGNKLIDDFVVSFSNYTYTPPTSIKVGIKNKKVTWLYYNKVLTTDELTQNYIALGGTV